MRPVIAIWFFMMVLQGSAQQPELVLPIMHAERVRVASFSPDGAYVLTGGADQALNLWETYTGKKLRRIEGFDSDIKDIQFSQTGKFVAVSTDSIISLYRFPSFALTAKYPGGIQFRFSGDEMNVFLLDYGGELYQFDIAGQLKNTFPVFKNIRRYGKDRQRQCFAVSPNNRFLATLGTELRIYEVSSGLSIWDQPQESTALGCVFDLKSEHLLFATEEGLKRLDLVSRSVENLVSSGLFAAHFDEKGKYVVSSNAAFRDRAVVWDVNSGKQKLRTDTLYSKYDTLAVHDTSGNVTIKTGELPFGFPSGILPYFRINVDTAGNWMQVGRYLWNLNDPARSIEIPGYGEGRMEISPGGEYVLAQSATGRVSLYRTATGKRVLDYGISLAQVKSFDLSPDGKTLAAVTGDSAVLVTDLLSGKTIRRLDDAGKVGIVTFNHDGSRMITNAVDNVARVWETNSGRLIQRYTGQHPEFNPAYFDGDGNVITIPPVMDTIAIADPEDPEKLRYEPALRPMPDNLIKLILNGKDSRMRFRILDDNEQFRTKFQLLDEAGSPVFEEYVYSKNIAWSADGRWVAQTWAGDSIKIYDTDQKKYVYTSSLGVTPDSYGYMEITRLSFSPDSRRVVFSDMNQNAHVLELPGFKIKKHISVGDAEFTSDGRYLVGLYQGGYRVYDLAKNETVYQRWAFDSTNFLVIDQRGRYDGTPEGRKSLYFSCGMEIVELQQFKEKLWVPELASRLMHNDSIFVKGISELQICGYTPEIRKRSAPNSRLEYLITPRQGGLGETAVYVNGLEIYRYTAKDLKKEGAGYLLVLERAKLLEYFLAKENEITVRSFTTDNSVSSRGFIHRDTSFSDPALPNLYAVMVGISDYKGEELDLKYAAKDASDISRAVSVAAKKLLNIDGKDHVFIYELTTNKGRYRTPEKLAIKKTIEEIGARCSVNDILMIFFAGHGTLEKEKKQFYFLAANASSGESAELADAGISTSELIEWISPAHVKAQKRILIFDACNSGQAINDLVKVGNASQGYVAARNDDRGQQVKLIEKLNERAGFTILSASASDQSAYELGRYAQGLLTYALLKSIKERPDILTSGEFLDVAKWFYAAGNSVEELIRNNAARQQPQLISNTSFVIGKIDPEVLASIKLPEEKQVFTGSILSNSTLNFDNLGLSRQLNAELKKLGEEESAPLLYQPDAIDYSTAFSINGNYEVKEGKLELQLRLIQGNVVKAQLKVECAQDALTDCLGRIREWILRIPKTD